MASIGTYSGPAGGTLALVLQGAEVWVVHVNKKGGINGHQVKLLVYDDAGDPARHRAQVQEAIEQRHVVAFLANAESLSGRSSVEYITAKRVPVIGSDTGSSWFYESPMYFPQASSGDALVYGLLAGLAQQTVPLGKTKLGSLVCIEAQICRDADKVFGNYAKGEGFDLVYRAKATLSQPDFTAECLAARNAGVQVFWMALDANSVQRVAASCARQRYRPLFSTAAAPLEDRFKDDPNLDGMVSSTNVFPYFQSGTGATDEYQQAMGTYGSTVRPGLGAATGWVAGRLLGEAGKDLSEPPTSEALLEGLWSLRNATLGGMTQPLTFVENQVTSPLSCWFNIMVRKGSWVSPDGFELQCRRMPGG